MCGYFSVMQMLYIISELFEAAWDILMYELGKENPCIHGV